VTSLSDARAHLGKAREFLDAAKALLDLGLHNAAASNAVTAGINAKDAISLKLTGQTRKTEDHRDAVSELKAIGPTAAGLAPTLGRLLQLKAKSQYRAASVSKSEATKAVEWARRLYEGAQTIVTS
jgi:HEPN domain-containing protein